MSPAAFSIHVNKHTYGSITALEKISLDIPLASLTAIIGPNGGGKSTLLKLLAGIYPLTKPNTITCAYNNRFDIAYLPQACTIDRHFPLLVEDVIAMGLWPKIGPFRRLGRDLRPQIQEILSKVGLAGLEKRSLDALSGGQVQRLFFGRLMAQDAPILLLDEPFAAIDPKTTQDLMTLLQDWHTQGKTIIAVLHDLNLVRRYFPQTLLLAKTKIDFGPSETVLVPETLAKAAFYV